MNDNELIQTLRLCADFVPECNKCPIFDDEDCVASIKELAADRLEALLAENERLIDSAELIFKLPIVEEDKQISLIGAVADVVTMILECKPVDAVEVVRCRDCKWYQEGELLAPNKFCFRLKHPKEDRKIGYNYAPDDFCSYGERKGALSDDNHP